MTEKIETYKRSLSGLLKNEYDLLFKDWAELFFQDGNKLKTYYDEFNNEIASLGALPRDRLISRFTQIYTEYLGRGGKLSKLFNQSSVLEDRVANLNKKIMVDYEWYDKTSKGYTKYVWVPYWVMQLWSWETFSTTAHNHGEFMNQAVKPIHLRLQKIKKMLGTNIMTYRRMIEHLETHQDAGYDDYLWVQHQAMTENTKTWIS